ncbi:hypothetical protein P879_08627 [Paragonimus westermani]|uniref:Uncharacterized protein n=1 Tax=Paragonimus westermani TaxID=34504 RepID=A0A8T0DPY1_9TREM|nr:hypothetical protein P879_08627 [Paragonimus westermani]
MGMAPWPFVLFLLIALGKYLCCCSWTVTVELNPNCTEECDTFNLVHVAARNESSSVHILFSASQRISPSILLLHSDVPTADPQIDWSKMLDPVEPVDAISLDGVTQSYAVLFSKVSVTYLV